MEVVRDRIRSGKDVGFVGLGEEERKALVRGVVEELRDGRDVLPLLKFVRRSLVVEEGLAGLYCEAGLVDVVGKLVREGGEEVGQEAAKLLNNLVVRGGRYVNEVWREVGVEGEDGAVVKGVVEWKSAPLVAFLHACVAAEPELGRELASPRCRTLLTALMEGLGVEGAMSEWALILLRRLIIGGVLPEVVEAVKGSELAVEFVFEAINELVQTTDLDYRVDRLLEKDVETVAIYARRGHVQALTCLGTYASTGKCVADAVSIVTDALRVSHCVNHNDNGDHRSEDGTRMKGTSSALRLLAFSVHNRPSTQDEVLANGETIPLVLNSMQIDMASPMMREWAVVCVRYLCENHEGIQEEIRSYEIQQAAESSVLRDAGLEAYIASDGKVKVRTVDRPPPSSPPCTPEL